ncbi:Crp/Fnr family transcriptional regulator [Sulfuriflexus mobilis]|uniref:Crp/Fnr family transcriptional regulator n=1 Tax=Sulfuriflexus mobilis TaxID=1811807 RepID=UPI000F848913|nr:Crp/Fnr family transcriptional regulator [Sulfuriflexus mobilis]
MTDIVKVSPAMIGTIEVFRQLSQQQRESLSPLLKARKYLANEHIISRGDDSKDVFFIVSGMVRVTSYTAGGKEVSFRDMSAGQMFGELSAIDGQSRSADVLALTESVLVVTPPDTFMRILRDYPDVTELILRQLTRLVRSLGDRVIEFSALSVKSRIHAEILRLAKKNILDDNSAEIVPAPTHLDIANRISTHREAVSREFSELSRSGILQRADGKLIIYDMARLEGLLDEVKSGP